MVFSNGGKNSHPFFFPTLLPLLSLIKYEATPPALWRGVDGSTPIASGKMCGHSDMLLHCKLCFQFQKLLKSSEKGLSKNFRQRVVTSVHVSGSIFGNKKYQFPFAVDAHCLKCPRYYAAPPAFGVKCESRGKGGRG